MSTSMATTVLKDLLSELRLWRAAPTARERIQSRPPDLEVPDPTPMEMPIGYERPPTTAELIQRFVRQEVSAQAAEQGLGTFAEEDDFDLGDEFDFPIGRFDVTEYDMEEIDVADAAPPPQVPPKRLDEAPLGDGTPPEPAPAEGAPASETEPPEPKQHWE